MWQEKTEKNHWNMLELDKCNPGFDSAYIGWLHCTANFFSGTFSPFLVWFMRSVFKEWGDTRIKLVCGFLLLPTFSKLLLAVLILVHTGCGWSGRRHRLQRCNGRFLAVAELCWEGLYRLSVPFMQHLVLFRTFYWYLSLHDLNVVAHYACPL